MTEKVRVLRVLEYEFDDLDAMHTHFGTLAVPLHGQAGFIGGQVRSTAFFPQAEHSSLFQIEQSASDVDMESGRSPVVVLALNLHDGLRWVDSHGGGEDFASFYVAADLEVLRARLSGTRRPKVVQTPKFAQHPQWGPMRSAAYARGVQVFTAEEWVERVACEARNVNPSKGYDNR